ncbi:MAG: 5-formyltetrahydrofolate cyclo-ligase [Vallitalea sp.]|jgi:5-formyltetrahydrofolate cyclo-ligase|nr:5-formyltetrahydrofolate cyclo-ligase [Vallitalea sp.]
MKTTLRKKYINIRNNMSEIDVFNKSINIYNKLITNKLYINCNEIFIYVSNFNEVDTSSIINKAWDDKKRVAVPKVCNNLIKFYYINSMQDLKKGKFNILEPTTLIEGIPTDNSLFIMPGIVFDKNRNRIGFGGGYYDKYLFSYPNIFKKVAICYDYQLIDKIPTDIHDVRPDYIFTESQIIS